MSFWTAVLVIALVSLVWAYLLARLMSTAVVRSLVELEMVKERIRRMLKDADQAHNSEGSQGRRTSLDAGQGQEAGKGKAEQGRS